MITISKALKLPSIEYKNIEYNVCSQPLPITQSAPSLPSVIVPITAPKLYANTTPNVIPPQHQMLSHQPQYQMLSHQSQQQQQMVSQQQQQQQYPFVVLPFVNPFKFGINPTK